MTLVACTRTTASGAAAFLGIGSDGHHYWVKAQNNPQGSRSLIPERIVTNLGRLIGAAVRPIALIEIPDTLDFTYAPGYRLRPGLAHGSLDLGQSKVLDDWSGVSHRDDNRRRIAGVGALWDLCLGNDPQWLVEFADDAALWSYDHGFWFAGEYDWSIDAMSRVAGDAWVAPNVSLASAPALNRYADAVDALSYRQIEAVALDVPHEWGTDQDELLAVAGILASRTEGVAERLRAVAATLDR